MQHISFLQLQWQSPLPDCSQPLSEGTSGWKAPAEHLTAMLTTSLQRVCDAQWGCSHSGEEGWNPQPFGLDSNLLCLPSVSAPGFPSGGNGLPHRLPCVQLSLTHTHTYTCTHAHTYKHTHTRMCTHARTHARHQKHSCAQTHKTTRWCWYYC